MAQYIDKSALVAEIERLFEKADKSLGEYRNGAQHTLISINDFLNTLEVKEVDLNKEIEKYLRTFSSSPDNGIEYSKKLARYFFELGLKVNNKAQKGE